MIIENNDNDCSKSSYCKLIQLRDGEAIFGLDKCTKSFDPRMDSKSSKHFKDIPSYNYIPKIQYGNEAY